MDNKSAIFGGNDSEKNTIAERNGTIFDNENSKIGYVRNGSMNDQGSVNIGNGGDLMNRGPEYDNMMTENNNSSEVLDFATEIENTLKMADVNGDGIVSVNEELEYMDDQGQTISKNLTKLTDRQALAVEKDINKQVNKGDARGAVISLQKWRDKMLDEAFGRHIGDRNAA